MKIVCISDTHCQHRELEVPDGDVFVHAGDITRKGEVEVVYDFAAWLKDLPHRWKIVVPGNHDFCFDADSPRFDRRVERWIESAGADLLIDRSTLIEGLKFHGSPWVVNLPLWAFNSPDESVYYRQIPIDTQVLVTHGPPQGMRDGVLRSEGWYAWKEHVGSQALRRRVSEMHDLKLIVAGHIHQAYGADGSRKTDSDLQEYPLMVNACSCDETYRIVNRPIVVEI